MIAGVRPVWPITGMSISTTRRMVSHRDARLLRSLTASAPPSLIKRLPELFSACSTLNLVSENAVGNDQRARRPRQGDDHPGVVNDLVEGDGSVLSAPCTTIPS